MTGVLSSAVLPAEVAHRYPYGYAVVDVETSGLRAASDRVLQVAVTQMAADGSIESNWSTLLDPGCDPGPTHIHGLTRAKLQGAPQYAVYAAVIYSRAAAERLGVPTEESARRIAARHHLNLPNDGGPR